MEKKVENKNVLIALGFIFAITVSWIAGMNSVEPKVQVKTEIKTVEKVVEVEDIFLQENACRLYDNYNVFYNYLLEECISNPYCKGSETQDQMTEKFNSFDEFRLEYCQ